MPHTAHDSGSHANALNFKVSETHKDLAKYSNPVGGIKSASHKQRLSCGALINANFPLSNPIYEDCHSFYTKVNRRIPADLKLILYAR